MISDVACEPELPPELMMSGMNSASTTARASSSWKCRIAVVVNISLEKKRGEPAARAS